MADERTFEGQVFFGDDLDLCPARVIVRDGRIAGVEELHSAPPRWICPAFFNAHTHLGDTVAMDLPLSEDLESLVTPPHGLKHRILTATPRQEVVAGMRTTLTSMAGAGIAGCADFREGGADGVAMLQEAAKGIPCQPVIFGREGGELVAEGLGISSVRDIDDAEIRVAAAKRAGKRVAFHAGERDSLDIDGALSFDPDLLIHCTHATDRQLRECADRGIPIAICSRSNWILGVTSSPSHPPIEKMRALGCSLLLGTDNVMLVPPEMFGEMSFLSIVYKVPPREVLHAAIAGGDHFNRTSFILPGSPARFFCVQDVGSSLKFSRDPWMTFIKRVNRPKIEENVLSYGRE